MKQHRLVVTWQSDTKIESVNSSDYELDELTLEPLPIEEYLMLIKRTMKRAVIDLIDMHATNIQITISTDKP